MKRIGYWISEKKSKKLNFEEHVPLFRNVGLDLVKIDLTQPLGDQGPFDAIVHKVTDILAKADNGNLRALQFIQNIQNYKDRHPECILFDPLESTRRLLDRYKQYQQVSTCDVVIRDCRVIIPTFVELTSSDVEENKEKLADAGVTFPIVVKPLLAHGSKDAHEMAIIFSEECLRDVSAPCVAQSFLNHNALLYKIFVIGNRQFVVQRPSLKNLYPGNHPTIFFDTQEVSKPGSSHPLNEVDKETIDEPLIKPDWDLLEQLGASISHAMEMSLLGIDVIIDRETQQYAIIDINSFPGFEGVDDFFCILRDHILERLQTKENCDRSRQGATITTSATGTMTSSSNITSTTTSCSTAYSAATTPTPFSIPFKADDAGHYSTQSVCAKTAAANAANLKASHKLYSDQPCVIDQDVPSSSPSLFSSRHSNRRDEDPSPDQAENQCYMQLRHKSNKSPSPL